MKLGNLFKDKAFYRALFTIALPIMLQNLINSFVNLIDTVMVGRLGTAEIAAVGLGNQVFFLLNIFLFGVCSGAGVFTAQFWGKKDVSGIRRTTGLCLSVALVIAGLFTIACIRAPAFIIGLYSKDPAVIALGADYLRAVAPCFLPFAVSFVLTIIMRSIERVKLAMSTTIVSLSIKIAISYCLIFGIGPFPALGVTGAAIATVIARVIEMIILLVASKARNYAFVGPLGEIFGFNLRFTARFFQIALPVIVNEMLWSLGITMQNAIFARTGTDAFAAFTILNTVSQLTWVFFIGLANGGSVLIGKKIGEGDERTARDYAARLSLFAPLMGILIALLLIPLSLFLPFAFNVDAGVFAIMSALFVILTAAYPFRAFNISMIIGVCRAGGDTVFGFFYDILIMWTFSLPLAALASFAFHAPVWVVYLCVCSEDPLKMLLGLWRLKSGKWLRDVTG
jgi:putative MATE family efflux protein